MSELRRLRLEAGMKQAELANRVGVSQATISSWEVGEINSSYA